MEASRPRLEPQPSSAGGAGGPLCRADPTIKGDTLLCLRVSASGTSGPPSTSPAAGGRGGQGLRDTAYLKGRDQLTLTSPRGSLGRATDTKVGAESICGLVS